MVSGQPEPKSERSACAHPDAGLVDCALHTIASGLAPLATLPC